MCIQGIFLIWSIRKNRRLNCGIPRKSQNHEQRHSVHTTAALFASRPRPTFHSINSDAVTPQTAGSQPTQAHDLGVCITDNIIQDRSTSSSWPPVHPCVCVMRFSWVIASLDRQGNDVEIYKFHFPRFVPTTNKLDMLPLRP